MYERTEGTIFSDVEPYGGILWYGKKEPLIFGHFSSQTPFWEREYRVQGKAQIVTKRLPKL